MITQKEADELAASIGQDSPPAFRARHRRDVWVTVRTICYDGSYDGGPEYDRRACGGVVHIQERTKGGKTERRAVTSNGNFSFVTPIGH